MESILAERNAQISGKQIVEPSADPEEVRRRAYELYELRGRVDGHDVEDWLQAEDEVKHQLAAA